jgi:redox-sensing transcriptional repressor
VIRRLPIYVRALQALLDGEVRSVSSDDLACLIGVTAAQIRRDLSYFGRFGKQGKGYDVARLLTEIKRILKLDQTWEVALVGFGNLGRAIVQYGGFLPSTFRIAAIFDRHCRPASAETADLPILPEERIADEVARQGIKIGIVAVPAESAQSVADALVRGGVAAILNYAPVVLRCPAPVAIRDIDPIGAIQSMTYYLEPQRHDEQP